jgi:hypothetical protein
VASWVSHCRKVGVHVEGSAVGSLRLTLLARWLPDRRHVRREMFIIPVYMGRYAAPPLALVPAHAPALCPISTNNIHCFPR